MATFVSFNLMKVLEPVGRAIQDLLKFSFVNAVDTKNKTLDSLINGLFLAVLSGICAYFASWSFQKRFYLWRMKTDANSLQDLYQQYDTDDQLRFVEWDTYRYESFTMKLIKYYSSRYGGYTIHSALYVDPRTTDVSCGPATIPDLLRNLGDRKISLFNDTNGIVFLMKSPLRVNNVILAYSNLEPYHKLMAMINDINLDDKEVKTNQNSKTNITESGFEINGGVETIYNRVHRMYTDRSFDTFISRHKATIMRRLDKFMEINKPLAPDVDVDFKDSCSTHHSYNVGIMLYGPPGTGKTLLMKCVANYLGRSLRVVDMRKVRTRAQWREIFSRNVEHYVYCFDEFDCVQGIIQERSVDDYADSHVKQRLAELKKQHFALLQCSATNTGDRTQIAKEIESVKKEIDNVSNELTIDAILTSMDGLIEQRGRVCIACTNHLSRIDPALLRPGRFDMIVELGKYTMEEIRDYLSMLYAGEPGGQKAIAAIREAKFPDSRWTPAEIVNMYYSCATVHEVIKALNADKLDAQNIAGGQSGVHIRARKCD